MWHGIVVDAAFADRKFFHSLKIIGKKESDGWILAKIDVPDKEVEACAKAMQAAMKEKFYSHLYSAKGDLIVIFKRKIFRIKADKSTWGPAVEYGKSIGIPEEQLDFFPCRFEDETY